LPLGLRPRKQPPLTAMRGRRPTFARASQNVAAVAMLLDMLLAPSADAVDKL
jgi:hypothetical protein